MAVLLVNSMFFLILYHIQLGIILRFVLAPIHICRIYEANLWSGSLKWKRFGNYSTKREATTWWCRLRCICNSFAVGILSRFAEIGKRFDVAKMKSYLFKCLEEEEFTLFPRSHKIHQAIKGAYYLRRLLLHM